MKQLNNFEVVVGCFSIKFNDLVFIDVLPDRYLNDSFKKKIQEIKKMSNLEMLGDLENRGIKISSKIAKLIQDNFFGNGPENFKEIYSRVAIIKGSATSVRAPKILIREGFPENFFLVPVKTTFSLAYLLTFIFTKEFLNFHNIDRIYIMSEPLEKFHEHDDNLIVTWDPSYYKGIDDTLYSNQYSGDKSTGYLFFCV